MLSISDVLQTSSLVITGENGAGKKAFAATIIDHIDDVTSHRYLTKIPQTDIQQFQSPGVYFNSANQQNDISITVIENVITEPNDQDFDFQSLEFNAFCVVLRKGVTYFTPQYQQTLKRFGVFLKGAGIDHTRVIFIVTNCNDQLLDNLTDQAIKKICTMLQIQPPQSQSIYFFDNAHHEEINWNFEINKGEAGHKDVTMKRFQNSRSRIQILLDQISFFPYYQSQYLKDIKIKRRRLLSNLGTNVFLRDLHVKLMKKLKIKLQDFQLLERKLKSGDEILLLSEGEEQYSNINLGNECQNSYHYCLVCSDICGETSPSFLNMKIDRNIREETSKCSTCSCFLYLHGVFDRSLSPFLSVISRGNVSESEPDKLVTHYISETKKTLQTFEELILKKQTEIEEDLQIMKSFNNQFDFKNLMQACLNKNRLSFKWKIVEKYINDPHLCETDWWFERQEIIRKLTKV